MRACWACYVRCWAGRTWTRTSTTSLGLGWREEPCRACSACCGCGAGPGGSAGRRSPWGLAGQATSGQTSASGDGALSFFFTAVGLHCPAFPALVPPTLGTPVPLPPLQYERSVRGAMRKLPRLLTITSLASPGADMPALHAEASLGGQQQGYPGSPLWSPGSLVPSRSVGSIIQVCVRGWCALSFLAVVGCGRPAA